MKIHSKQKKKMKYKKEDSISSVSGAPIVKIRTPTPPPTPPPPTPPPVMTTTSAQTDPLPKPTREDCLEQMSLDNFPRWQPFFCPRSIQILAIWIFMEWREAHCTAEVEKYRTPIKIAPQRSLLSESLAKWQKSSSLLLYFAFGGALLKSNSFWFFFII